MLRTFDDLNYRQEQRFHLELGLMKLVHAQRLLPLEELLSSVASGKPVRSGESSAPRSTPANSRSSPPPASSAPRSHSSSSTPSAPRSPFGSGPVMQSAPRAESHAVSGSAALATPRPDVAPVGSVIQFPSAAVPQPVLAVEPEAQEQLQPQEATPIPAAPLPPPQVAPSTPVSGATPESVQHAIVSGLAQNGHASASTLLSTARFTLEATSLRIEVPGIGKKMLALTVNPAAEKIIKHELQRLGAPVRFMVIPGEGVAATSSLAAPVQGSIQQAALEHPMVQRAKEIFKAEVRSVVDLRSK
jgi:DNA polymerase III subunit gamma/tau